MVKFLFRTVAVLLVLTGALLAYGLLLPAGPTQQKLVQLKSGSSARHIAAELANASLPQMKRVAELREMLAEAVRNSQAENKRLQKAKRVKAA